MVCDTRGTGRSASAMATVLKYIKMATTLREDFLMVLESGTEHFTTQMVQYKQASGPEINLMDFAPLVIKNRMLGSKESLNMVTNMLLATPCDKVAPRLYSFQGNISKL